MMTVSRHPFLPRLVLLLASVLGSAPLRADELPAALNKDAPATVKELRALEAQVQKVLDKVVPCTVGIRIGFGQGSGVIISEDGYVLTAGHVSGDPGREDIIVIMPDGKQLKAKSLGRNKFIDSGLIKISVPGKYPFAEMGQSAPLQKGQWVIGVGHPGGYRLNRTPVVRLGRVLNVNPFLIQTDCTLVGGDSGGPLFDLEGKVVGIHSRIGGRSITENIHVPVDTYRDTWDRLVRSDNWGEGLGQQPAVKSAGGKIIFEKKDRLSADDPTSKFIGGKNFKVYTLPLKSGATYTFDLFSRFQKGGFDAYLRLEDTTGTQLAEDDDGGGQNNARIVYRVVRDGDYRVVVTSCDPEQYGGFVLTVREADRKDDDKTK